MDDCNSGTCKCSQTALEQQFIQGQIGIQQAAMNARSQEVLLAGLRRDALLQAAARIWLDSGGWGGTGFRDAGFLDSGGRGGTGSRGDGFLGASGRGGTGFRVAVERALALEAEVQAQTSK